MNARLRHLVGATVIPVVLVVLSFVTLTARATPATTSSTVAWIDDFDGSTLNSRWSWTRENPAHWSLTARPGFLRITTEYGGLWGALNNQRNLLLATAPNGNFRIETRVTFTPTQFIQTAGLIIYQDDDNYIKLNRQFVDNNVVELIREIAGSPSFTAVVESANTVYLRMQRDGNVYTGYYSVDGNQWTRVGQYTATLNDAKMGLGAGNDVPDVSEIAADFDFFRLDDKIYRVMLPLILK